MSENAGSPQPPRSILLATNLSSRADRAFDRAVQLAHAWQAGLHIVHAVESASAGGDAEANLQRHPDAKATALQQLGQLAGQNDVRAAVHVEHARAADAILAVAAREACDLIVLGEERERLLGPLEGTVEEVIRTSPVSVLAVRARVVGPYRRLLVGTDFTDEARQALVASASLFPEAAVTLIHAYLAPYTGSREAAAEAQVWTAELKEALRAHLHDADIPVQRRASIATAVDIGPPAAVLRRHITEERDDLTVIGAHPRSLLFDAVVGSSRLIVDAIPGDILIVRALRREAP